MNKYAVYERIKTEIARTSKTPAEYEKKIEGITEKTENLAELY